MTPGARIIHPEFGDVTADVMEELLAMARFKEPVILEREQAEIAAASGAMAQDLCFGRVVAEIHPEVFDEWVAKEGQDFFKKSKGGDGVEYLTKHFPATRVDSRSKNVALHVHRSEAAPVRSAVPRYRVTGRRGRWAA